MSVWMSVILKMLLHIAHTGAFVVQGGRGCGGVVDGQGVLSSESSFRSASGGDSLRVVAVRVAGQGTETETARFRLGVGAPTGWSGARRRMAVAFIAGVHVT